MPSTPWHLILPYGRSGPSDRKPGSGAAHRAHGISCATVHIVQGLPIMFLQTYRDGRERRWEAGSTTTQFIPPRCTRAMPLPTTAECLSSSTCRPSKRSPRPRSQLAPPPSAFLRAPPPPAALEPAAPLAPRALWWWPRAPPPPAPLRAPPPPVALEPTAPLPPRALWRPRAWAVTPSSSGSNPWRRVRVTCRGCA